MLELRYIFSNMIIAMMNLVPAAVSMTTDCFQPPLAQGNLL